MDLCAGSGPKPATKSIFYQPKIMTFLSKYEDDHLAQMVQVKSYLRTRVPILSPPLIKSFRSWDFPSCSTALRVRRNYDFLLIFPTDPFFFFSRLVFALFVLLPLFFLCPCFCLPRLISGILATVAKGLSFVSIFIWGGRGGWLVWPCVCKGRGIIVLRGEMEWGFLLGCCRNI